MRIAISHTTRLDYTAEVVEGVMDTRLGALSDLHQHWERFGLRVNPLAAVRRYTDGFGNTAHLISISGPHRFIEITTESEVETLLADPFAPPTIHPRKLDPSEKWDYLAPSALIPENPDLKKLAEPFRPATREDTFESARRLMELVYSGFDYQKDVTGVFTTVAEVIQNRTGVCQDFAHVLIGLCRAVDIPARYLSGYIVASSQAQSQSSNGRSQSQNQRSGPSRGAGASHAWVEAYTPTHGWRGFDPTNNLVASEHHVKMGVGRDYTDVPPTRGTFRGSADEKLSVEVETRLLD